MNQKNIRSLAIALGLVASLGTTVALERTASACGGCFVPPEDNTVVTDHRMILSVGNGESTLYDQIRYQGLPQEFAWVLPISGEATVGLSADTLFGVMGGFTSVNVVAPPRNCPAAPNCNSGEDLAAEAPRASSADSGSAGGVTVNNERTFGGAHEQLQGFARHTFRSRRRRCPAASRVAGACGQSRLWTPLSARRRRAFGRASATFRRPLGRGPLRVDPRLASARAESSPTLPLCVWA